MLDETDRAFLDAVYRNDRIIRTDRQVECWGRGGLTPVQKRMAAFFGIVVFGIVFAIVIMVTI